jgi:hypothetical protein
MEKQVNYRGLFFAGIVFLGAGVALSLSIGAVGYVILCVGVAMIVVGVSRRSNWDQ